MVLVHFNRPLRTAWRQHPQNSEGLWDSHASRWSHMTLFMSPCLCYIRACFVPWLPATEKSLRFGQCDCISCFLYPLKKKKKKGKHIRSSKHILVLLLAWVPLSICCLIYSFITLFPIIFFYCPPSSTRVQITPLSLWMSFPVILWLESWRWPQITLPLLFPWPSLADWQWCSVTSPRPLCSSVWMHLREVCVPALCACTADSYFFILS